MARRSYSKHIPDFRYVTYFGETGKSAVHSMNPWTKIALLFFVVALVTVVMDLYWLLIIMLLTIAFYACGRLPLRVLVGWYSLPVFFVASLSILYIFTEPGTDLLRTRVLGMSVAITESGVMLMLTLLVRALAVVTFSLAVFMTTKYTHITIVASRIMPGTLANIFLLSYRFMFETSDEVSDVIDAMRSRGGNLAKGALRQTRMFAGIFGIAFVHAFDRAERIAKAMEARGYAGRFPVTEALPRPTAGGYALMALGMASLVLATYSRYFDRGLFGW